MNNENSSGRGARKPSGSKDRKPSGFRDGKPSGFKSRSSDKPRSPDAPKGRGGSRPGGDFKDRGRRKFGERAEGSEGFERKPRGDRQEGSGEQRKSTDWSTGGYRITKKGAGKGNTGFKGFNKEEDKGFKGPKRDYDKPGARGPRRDTEGKTGYRGFKREDEQGFRGPKRDYDKPGARGPRRDAEGKTGFRGPKRDAEPRTGGFRDSRSGFEKKGPRSSDRRFDNQRPREDALKKKQTQAENSMVEDLEREDRVEGRNPVLEALRSGRPLNKLFVEKDNDDPSLMRIIAIAREKNIPIQYLERFKLDTMSQTRIHQGVILEVAAQEYVEVEDILKKAKEKNEKPFLLILDGITDTNNLGSIIRSAECAGVHGIILPKRRSATLNATVAKVAAGALEYVPVARVTNLVQTLRELKAEGIWIIGADMDGDSNYYDADLTGPCALVIGSEGEGLARLVKDECDLMVRIPMKGKISSLNAGVAAALILFDIVKQRG